LINQDLLDFLTLKHNGLHLNFRNVLINLDVILFSILRLEWLILLSF